MKTQELPQHVNNDSSCNSRGSNSNYTASNKTTNAGEGEEAKELINYSSSSIEGSTASADSTTAPQFVFRLTTTTNIIAQPPPLLLSQMPLNNHNNANNNDNRPWTMHTSSGDDEASKDPRIGEQDFTQQFTENDFEGHRAHSVYVGVHVPGGRRHSQRRRKHHHSKSESSGDERQPEVERPVTPPAQRVQFILGEDADDGTHVSHPLFSEYLTLVKEGDEIEWKETARWIKFEEDVEEGGNRWSKPHVATLSLHSLFELRSLLLNGTVILDMEANNLDLIADLACEHMVNARALPPESRDKVKDALLRRHRHQHEYNKKTKLPIIRSLADIGRNQSSSKMEDHSYSSAPGLTATSPLSLTASTNGNKSDDISAMGGRFLTVPGGTKSPKNLSVPNEDMIKSPSSQSIQRNSSGTDLSDHRGNMHFMRKIPPGAEASNILVGEVEFLEKPLAGFIRLKEASVMGDLTEVPVPTRFIFILLGPPGSQSNFHEIGRAMATLMSDEIFHEVAYRARKRDHLLAGIDEFLDAVTVLPPGEWDPTIRIEPPAAIPSQEIRKRPPEVPKEEVDEEEEEQRLREESGLSRSGRLFGGLINDVKRKAPFYLSDFTDGVSMQCVASWIFLYFACLSPIITFGGLLSQATGKNMAAMESLVSGFVCGIGYGLFSGQPLTILGSTGPVLVFETIVYDFCLKQGWDYMTFRFWIGTWIAVILLILTAIDASALVCYITRFTEENFATLIAFIFIMKAVENVLKIGKKFPVNQEIYDCVCTPPPGSNATILDFAKYEKNYCLANNGTLVGLDCDLPDNSNIFLMSVILFLGTFIISTILKDFKNALFFPTVVRQYISDFSVIIAIVSMSLLDFLMQVDTPKLEVPHELKPTLPSRDWLIPPFTENNPIWSAVIAVIPAMLGTILIFMDQQITAVIINRKENKLKKGCGYHLDLFILAILIQICSVMGLPWFVAATVLSINHVNSLKQESECSAPGEKPQFLGVREQRVTHVLIFLTIGLSVFLTPILCHIPMPVLFGVFLYMGVASLKGLQFFDRILIMFMPAKYQPDYMFLRQVPIKRVHLFTFIQLACLIALWLIKSFSSTSILFPLMLVVMIGIRKSLDLIFTRRELKILDDIMPEMTKRQNADDLHQLDAEDHHHDKYEKYNSTMNPGPTTIHIPLANGGANNNATPNLQANVTQDVQRTTIWQQVNKDGTSADQLIIPVTAKVRQINGSQNKNNQRLSTMNEEDDENLSTPKNFNNLTLKVEACKDMTNNGSSNIIDFSKNDITPV
ncbi:electroneutral sodium bicarbonate exchanger 1 isoform X3 [Lucilia sericata]|uniref:electroneutral sodium bicarbonate exchanger 1 isoform X3 n=1 Tax=Lucilia sericata TaxID=13632 RepID=UPI0018A84251|nr:electroneutral sodium bicarbonate exchanger 1 isoform X3 [Lucilia sericata]